MKRNASHSILILCAGMISISACESEGDNNGDSNNQSPIAVNDNAQTPKETPITIDVIANDHDPDGTLRSNSIAIVSPPSNGRATPNANGTITYTPDTGFAGPTDTFTYTVDDDRGVTSNTATVTVSIQNQAPVAENDCQNIRQEDPLTGLLPGSDPDNSPSELTFSLLENGSDAGTGPIFTSKGQVEITDPTTGAFTYTPNEHPSRRGADTFEYRVEDTEGDSDTGVITVIINPKIMPLGDSITEGIINNGNPTEANRVGYRKPLYDALIADGYDFDLVGSRVLGSAVSNFDPDSEGHAGARDEEIADDVNDRIVNYTGIVQALNDDPADIVLLHIGTNDLNQNPGDTSADDVDTILTLINSWETSANGNPVAVVLARIIDQCDDVPNNDCGVGQPAIVMFNDNVVSMAQGLGTNEGPDELTIVNQRAVLLDQSGVPDPSLYGNRLHPNTQGYNRMADAWLNKLTDPNDRPSILEKCQ